MAYKGLATQAELAEFLDVLDRMASNLAFHINEPLGTLHGNTLSQAHGIDLELGYIDAYGNDLRTFQDSNGDLVSDAWSAGKPNFVRFVINGQPYWAPLQDTALDGQAPETGMLRSTDPTADRPAGSTLITDYITTEGQTADNIDNLLREHTKLAHQHAHVALTVTPTVTLDSAGHKVGSHIIAFQYKGIVYSIPVSDRFGGPVQPPRNVSLTGNTYVHIGAGDGNDCNNPLTASASGSLPFTYQFQVYDSGTWNNITPGTSATLSITGWDPGVGYTWASTSSNIFRIISVNPGSDETRSTRFRCVITGPGGSATTNELKFTAKDDTGNWIVSRTLETRSDAQNMTLERLKIWALRHRPEPTTFYLGDHGRQLLERMIDQGCDFEAMQATVLRIFEQTSHEARYALFEQMVADSLAAYWPDCPHPTGQKLIALVKEPAPCQTA